MNYLAMKYTPGPWTVNSQKFAEPHVEFSDIGQAWNSYCLVKGTNRIHNANLIAAAPNLFEALEAVSAFYRLDSESSELAIKVRQALAKARGKI
jgi:hypothetical protein